MDDNETSAQAEPVIRHLEHAQVQMLQAGMAQGADRESLLAEAKDALIRAEHNRPGSGAWLLACISASGGNGALCRQWLERALHCGTLPESAALTSSPYLAAVRGQKWFKKLLKGIPEGHRSQDS